MINFDIVQGRLVKFDPVQSWSSLILFRSDQVWSCSELIKFDPVQGWSSLILFRTSGLVKFDPVNSELFQV